MTESTLTTIEHHIPSFAASDLSVSAWSVGMQLHHALLATNNIAGALLASVPSECRPDFNPLRLLVMLFGDFPRGRGKAPKRAWPSESITEAELRELLASGREALEQAVHADPSAWWKHFAFGVMRRDTAIKFIHLHNRHHLKIVDDILKS